jgi:hypothetical protein
MLCTWCILIGFLQTGTVFRTTIQTYVWRSRRKSSQESHAWLRIFFLVDVTKRILISRVTTAEHTETHMHPHVNLIAPVGNRTINRYSSLYNNCNISVWTFFRKVVVRFSVSAHVELTILKKQWNIKKTIIGCLCCLWNPSSPFIALHLLPGVLISP